MGRRLIRRTSVTIKADENLFNMIQNVRKEFKKKNKIDISNIQASKILSHNIKNIKIPNINLIGGRKRNVRKKR